MTDYDQSIKITKKIISQIREELNFKTSILFNCEKNTKWNSIISEIADENNFIYINYPQNILSEKKNIYKDGGHLSEIGNINLGKYLYKEIAKEIIF